MPYGRDPLSVYYDGYVRQVMTRAIRASRSHRGVRVWIASPRGEFSRPDAGGRTTHERAFTRSAYYLIRRAPLNAGEEPDLSLKITWGEDSQRRPSSQGRLARPALVRLYPRDQARVTGPSWVDRPELRSGGIGSGNERF